MLSIDEVLAHKDTPAVLAARLTGDDIRPLLALMLEQKTTIRYAAYLVLQQRSRLFPDVYPHWDLLLQELDSPNAFHRDSALTILAENVRWDSDRKFDLLYPRYPQLFHDESFVVCRGVIGSVGIWLEHRPDLASKAVSMLLALDPAAFRHPNLILQDILKVLIPYQKRTGDESVACYILNALTGGILAKKKAIELELLWTSQK